MTFRKNFKLKEYTHKIQHLYAFENNTYFSIANNQNSISELKFFNPDDLVVVFEGTNDNVTSNKLKYYLAYPYIYKFQMRNADLIVSRTNMREYREDQWTVCLNLPLSTSKNGQMIFHHSIIKGNKITFFVIGDVTKILYFDAKTRELHELYSVDSEMANFKIFKKADSHYLLLGNGQMFEIVIKDTVSIVFRQQL